MKARLSGALFGLLVCFGLPAMGDQHSSSADGADMPEAVLPLSLEDIMTGVETRYGDIGFSARFEQISTIKAMEITDTASGRIIIKRPGKMRWVYERPDRQIIVTDGKTLWVYKPDDNQVMIGSYPTFFGDGKGAGFLTDMKLVRKKFQISLEKRDDKGNYVLKLLPNRREFDISFISLLISAGTFDVLQVSTYNFDGDETRIELKDIEFKEELDEALFHFDIPDGIDVLQLEE